MGVRPAQYPIGGQVWLFLRPVGEKSWSPVREASEERRPGFRECGEAALPMSDIVEPSDLHGPRPFDQADTTLLGRKSDLRAGGQQLAAMEAFTCRFLRKRRSR